MVKEGKFSPMVMNMLDDIRMVSLKDKGNTYGRSQDAPSKAHSVMVNEMVRVYGPTRKEISMLEAILKILSQAMANFIGDLVTFIKAITCKTKDRVMARCFGVMVVCTKVSGIREFNMARENYTLLGRKHTLASSKITCWSIYYSLQKK